MIKAAEFKFQKSFLSCYSLWRGTYFHTMDKNLRQWECGSFKWKRKEGGEEMGVVWKPQNGKVLWCMKNSNYVFLLFILPVQRDQPRSVLHTEIHKSSLLKITSKSDTYVDYTNYALSLPGKRATTIWIYKIAHSVHCSFSKINQIYSITINEASNLNG